MREERRRRDHLVRCALGGLAAAGAALTALLVLFVLRPSVPERLHSYLVGSPATQAREIAGPDGAGETSHPADIRPEELRQLLVRAGSTATADRKWLDGLYEGQMDSSRVKSLEEERLFALRRFQLTSGRTIVVLTEIGGDLLQEPTAELSTMQEF